MYIYICVIYIYDVYLVCNDGRLKTKKKIEFFHFFAECHDHDTRQSWESRTLSFPALLSAYLQHSAKKIQKKKKKNFAECQMQALGKAFLKKNKKHISLPSADAWHSAKGSSRRLFYAECHRGTREILCRVPDMWHSAKKPLS